jgi:two-component system cell cycle sensor histidine kinase/response regulator CckA
MGEDHRSAAEGVRDSDGNAAERRRYEQALQSSEERFRRLAEASYEGVTIIEGDRIVDANPQAASMVGYELSEYIGMPVLNLVAPEGRAAVADLMLVDDTRPWEGFALHKNGSKVLVEARSRLVRSGESVVRVTVFRDIGERRAMEERLRETEKMQVIGRLASSVAHDFNNLLSVILGCAHLLDAELAGQDSARGLVSEIAAAGERASALTRQLLTFSRRHVPDPRVLDVNAVIRGMTQMLSRLLGLEVRVSMQLEGHPSLVQIDPGQLEQVVMNLCTNARDALPEGGEIVIRTEAVASEAAARADGAGPDDPPSGRWVHVVVSDGGIGMDPVTLSRAFEPLFTTKALGRGTGLGLATVQAIVSQNGGKVTIESRVTRGTTAHVWLPAFDVR